MANLLMCLSESKKLLVEKQEDCSRLLTENNLLKNRLREISFEKKIYSKSEVVSEIITGISSYFKISDNETNKFIKDVCPSFLIK